MFAFWYIVFGLAALLVAMIIYFEIDRRRYNKDEQKRVEEEYKRLSTVYADVYKDYPRYYLVRPEPYDSNARDWHIAIVVGLLIGLLLICAVGSICATHEVNALLCEYDALRQLADSRQDFDKIAITQRIIDYNTKVAGITARLQTYKDWSIYIGTNADALQFIVF